MPSAQPDPTLSRAADEPPEGFRDQESAERADWLEGRMEDFLLQVQPELKESGMSRSCTASGRICTFEGPMSDDFVRSWLDALAYGAMSNEGTLQGVEFSELSFIDTEDGRNFSITAKHPSAD